ncbi:hypothetical protein H6G89_10180 [Oscillatoria sp. FACHB-1407]|uniref:hypothetical protein n=1 Tax=Oscillatoria sp. FACHB-1407 TaxID=2692847 RepID=UPI0016862F6A|nr:hypothetical protein [Oscillatoria sp. FACHB-1407]MBD2461415.1 hypothetical protein [Oscillatoria sp. FACHB-1407]
MNSRLLERSPPTRTPKKAGFDEPTQVGFAPVAAVLTAGGLQGVVDLAQPHNLIGISRYQVIRLKPQLQRFKQNLHRFERELLSFERLQLMLISF